MFQLTIPELSCYSIEFMSNNEDFELQSVLLQNAIQLTTPVESIDTGQALDYESPKKNSCSRKKDEPDLKPEKIDNLVFSYSQLIMKISDYCV